MAKIDTDYKKTNRGSCIPRVDGSIPDRACQAVTISKLLSLYVSPSRFLHTRTEPSSENNSDEIRWEKKERIQTWKETRTTTTTTTTTTKQKNKKNNNKTTTAKQWMKYILSLWRRSLGIWIKRCSLYGQYSNESLTEIKSNFLVAFQISLFEHFPHYFKIMLYRCCLNLLKQFSCCKNT